MSSKIEISRETLERISYYWDDDRGTGIRSTLLDLVNQYLAAPVVERKPSGQWRIIVSGEWFYGTKEQCERERAEFESTFTAEDFEDYEAVVPEQIYSGAPPELAELQAELESVGEDVGQIRSELEDAESDIETLTDHNVELQTELAAIKDECIDHVNLYRAWTGEREALRAEIERLKSGQSVLKGVEELLYDMLQDDDMPAHWFGQRIDACLDKVKELNQ